MFGLISAHSINPPVEVPRARGMLRHNMMVDMSFVCNTSGEYLSLLAYSKLHLPQGIMEISEAINDVAERIVRRTQGVSSTSWKKCLAWRRGSGRQAAQRRAQLGFRTLFTRSRSPCTMNEPRQLCRFNCFKLVMF